jgi:hypothetical protein
MKKTIYLHIALLFWFFGFSQKITTSIDSSQIKIGSQFLLTIKASVNAKDKVVFPEGKFFGALEVLESFPIDTVKNNAQYELIKKYGLTQFDSGRYAIPKLLVNINQKAFRTDSLSILVNNVTVDTTKQQMHDIKNIIATEEEPGSEWWKWLVLLVLIIASGFASYFIIKKIQKREDSAEEFFASPIEKAIAYLQNLDKKQLIRFARELMDIWNYRANLSYEIKREIVPQYSDPFNDRTINVNNLRQCSFIQIRKYCVSVIDTMINSGINSGACSLGSYYVLCALTIVSADAAESLPWLYEATIY